MQFLHKNCTGTAVFAKWLVFSGPLASFQKWMALFFSRKTSNNLFKICWNLFLIPSDPGSVCVCDDPRSWPWSFWMPWMPWDCPSSPVTVPPGGRWRLRWIAGKFMDWSPSKEYIIIMMIIIVIIIMIMIIYIYICIYSLYNNIYIYILYMEILENIWTWSTIMEHWQEPP